MYSCRLANEIELYFLCECNRFTTLNVVFFLLPLNNYIAKYFMGKLIILDAFTMVLYGHPGVSPAMNVKLF